MNPTVLPGHLSTPFQKIGTSSLPVNYSEKQTDVDTAMQQYSYNN